jgi:hypothetical protein
VTYPDRYPLMPAAAGVLKEFEAVVQANKITHVREGGPSMADWLAQMETKYDKPARQPAG